MDIKFLVGIVGLIFFARLFYASYRVMKETFEMRLMYPDHPSIYVICIAVSFFLYAIPVGMIVWPAVSGWLATSLVLLGLAAPAVLAGLLGVASAQAMDKHTYRKAEKEYMKMKAELNRA